MVNNDSNDNETNGSFDDAMLDDVLGRMMDASASGNGDKVDEILNNAVDGMAGKADHMASGDSSLLDDYLRRDWRLPDFLIGNAGDNADDAGASSQRRDDDAGTNTVDDEDEVEILDIQVNE